MQNYNKSKIDFLLCDEAKEKEETTSIESEKPFFPWKSDTTLPPRPSQEGSIQEKNNSSTASSASASRNPPRKNFPAPRNFENTNSSSQPFNGMANLAQVAVGVMMQDEEANSSLTASSKSQEQKAVHQRVNIKELPLRDLSLEELNDPAWRVKGNRE